MIKNNSLLFAFTFSSLLLSINAGLIDKVTVSFKCPLNAVYDSDHQRCVCNTGCYQLQHDNGFSCFPVTPTNCELKGTELVCKTGYKPTNTGCISNGSKDGDFGPESVQSDYLNNLKNAPTPSNSSNTRAESSTFSSNGTGNIDFSNNFGIRFTSSGKVAASKSNFLLDSALFDGKLSPLVLSNQPNNAISLPKLNLSRNTANLLTRFPSSVFNISFTRGGNLSTSTSIDLAESTTVSLISSESNRSISD